MLDEPSDFGVDPAATWRPATSLPAAARLARAVEQHLLAVHVGRLLRRHRNSIPDLARAVALNDATLRRKLHGDEPASYEDLVTWAWIVGGRPELPDLAKLATASVGLPDWPLDRARARKT